jgi:hypothetical protein
MPALCSTASTRTRSIKRQGDPLRSRYRARREPLCPRDDRALGPSCFARQRKTSLAAYPIPWEGPRKWRHGRDGSGRLRACGDSRREPAST